MTVNLINKFLLFLNQVINNPIKILNGTLSGGLQYEINN